MGALAASRECSSLPHPFDQARWPLIIHISASRLRCVGKRLCPEWRIVEWARRFNSRDIRLRLSSLRPLGVAKGAVQVQVWQARRCATVGYAFRVVRGARENKEQV